MNDIIEVDRPLAPQQTAIAEQSPMGMMLSAMSQGASLEQIEKMMALQERWEAGEARKAYNTAFAAFKAAPRVRGTFAA